LLVDAVDRPSDGLDEPKSSLGARAPQTDLGDSKISGAPAPHQPDANPDANGLRPPPLGEWHGRESFRLTGGRIGLKLGEAEREILGGYAQQHSIPLSEAARQLIRLALEKPVPDPEEVYQKDLWTEMILHNLIQGEQLLLLLQKLSPYGGLNADEVLVEAAQAAQRRIARGHEPEAPPK
jgi:hypothetical protein